MRLRCFDSLIMSLSQMACCRHQLYQNHYINGKRVLLTKLKGAGTASGSFDRGGYCVSVLSPQSPLPFVFAILFA